jgi:hypothetical protein
VAARSDAFLGVPAGTSSWAYLPERAREDKTDLKRRGATLRRREEEALVKPTANFSRHAEPERAQRGVFGNREIAFLACGAGAGFLCWKGDVMGPDKAVVPLYQLRTVSAHENCA